MAAGHKFTRRCRAGRGAQRLVVRPPSHDGVVRAARGQFWPVGRRGRRALLSPERRGVGSRTERDGLLARRRVRAATGSFLLTGTRRQLNHCPTEKLELRRPCCLSISSCSTRCVPTFAKCSMPQCWLVQRRADRALVGVQRTRGWGRSLHTRRNAPRRGKAGRSPSHSSFKVSGELVRASTRAVALPCHPRRVAALRRIGMAVCPVLDETYPCRTTPDRAPMRTDLPPMAEIVAAIAGRLLGAPRYATPVARRNLVLSAGVQGALRRPA